MFVVMKRCGKCNEEMTHLFCLRSVLPTLAPREIASHPSMEEIPVSLESVKRSVECELPNVPMELLVCCLQV